MGFASYFEDINSRLARIEEIVKDYDKSSGKGIELDEYIRLRREVTALIERVRPYIDQDIHLIENGELRKQNQTLTEQSQNLRGQNQNLMERNAGLQIGITRLKQDLTSLETTKNQIDSELAERESQLKKMTDESDTLKKRITDRARELFGLKITEHDLSGRLLDFDRRFEAMNTIIKSNAWYKDKECIRQLKSLIESGTRKN